MNWKDELVGQVAVAFLGAALIGLLFAKTLPQPNHDIALAIVSGLLGYISRGRGGPPSPPTGGVEA